MKKVHLRYYGGNPLCNIQNRWQSCDVTTTGGYKKVTCKRCRKIAEHQKFACTR